MPTSLLIVAPTGQQVYTRYRSKTLNEWVAANVSPVTLELYNAVHWANYAVNDPEDTGSGQYIIRPPSTLPFDWYDALHYQTGLSSTPAVGDTFIGSDDVEWDGTDIVFHGLPVAPATCILYDYEWSEKGAVEGSDVFASLSNPPQTLPSGILESSTQATASRWDGYWEIPLIQGKMYVIRIPSAGIDWTITCPAQARVQLRTLAP